MLKSSMSTLPHVTAAHGFETKADAYGKPLSKPSMQVLTFLLFSQGKTQLSNRIH